MIRKSCISVLALAAIMLALPVAAQVGVAGGTPTAKGAAGFSTVPMAVVYEFFMKEFVALQDVADSLEAQGRSARETRALLRDMTGLNEAEYRLLADAARESVSRMKQAEQEMKGLGKRAGGADLDEATRNRLSELRRTRQNAAIDAMTQVRRSLDIKIFSRLENLMRQRIVPNVLAKPLPPPAVVGNKQP